MMQGTKLETMDRCYQGTGSQRELGLSSLAFRQNLMIFPLGRNVAGKTQTLVVYLDQINS